MSTNTTVAKGIEKKCPRTQPWPKELKRNVHDRNRGQRNRKEMSTTATVAKELKINYGEL